MFKKTGNESFIDDRRFVHATILILIFIALLISRIWYLQLYRGEHYNQISKNNRIRKIEIPAPRGIVFDRKGQVILGNRPFYDLVLIPQFVKEKKEVILILSKILNEPFQKLNKNLKKSRGLPRFLPITLKRNLTLHEVEIIEEIKAFLPGIDIKIASRRDLAKKVPAHIFGYVGEISQNNLKKRNDKNPDHPYFPGDLTGKYGLESEWESYLRGKRGYKYIQVDARGRQTKENQYYEDFFSRPAIPGGDLVLTIDSQLQRAAEAAFYSKNGALVALDPQSGDVLAMVSAPSFNPAIYQRGISQDQWQSLVNNPFKPLFDKTTGGAFPPGSVYKPIVAFAALEEGVATTKTRHKCIGHFQFGRDKFHCWKRSGHGPTNLEKSLRYSCDVYYYQLGVELGIDKIAKYAKDFALGSKLNLSLNKEHPGVVPTNAWRKKHFKRVYTLGDAPNIAIGQGDNLMTPLQIASLYATIANGGKVWRPQIVKKVFSPMGELIVDNKPTLIKKVSLVSQKNFKIMRSILQAVVDNKDSTGRAAKIKNHSVAGKTGSSQVVSLKKSRNRKLKKVRMHWQEHALFAAFSPTENAEIVVAVISEHDSTGGGGSAAAPIAKKVIEAYWKIKDQDLQKKKTNRNIAKEKLSTNPRGL